MNTSGSLNETKSADVLDSTLKKSSFFERKYSTTKKAPDLINDYLWKFETPMSRSGKSRNTFN